ncbi:MAG: hypothetical protein JNL82_11175 [Myxococcales bacterium]|jgi:hypothetical protein|nr:hypothetical protein [Myxococcales bacterium]
MLHVTIGPITMRLEPDAARTLRDVLAVGLAAISEPRGGPHLRLASSRGDEPA